MATGSEQIVKEKLKILCLHGYRQNGKMFNAKLGAFRKIVNKHAELVFITADLPVVVVVVSPMAIEVTADDQEEDDDDDDQQQQRPYGWWFSKADDDGDDNDKRSFDARDCSDTCDGFQQSVANVKKAIAEQGPFDGVLGFSQGAAFAALLLALQQRGEEKFGFKFAVLIAAFKSRSTRHTALYDRTIECPSLHVIGETDKVIPEAMSQELVAHFDSPTILRHPGGHFAPAASRQKKVYLDFLERMLINVCK